MEASSKNYILPLILSAVFLLIGASLILFPDFIRRFDQQITRYIKVKDEYNVYLKILGLGFLLFSAVAFMFTFLEMSRIN